MNQKKQADQDQNPPIKIFNPPIKIPATINWINTHGSIPIKTHTSHPWELHHSVVSRSRASEIVPFKLRHGVVCLLRSYWWWVRSVDWGEIDGLRERWNDREVRVRRLYTVERESCEPERVERREKQILSARLFPHFEPKKRFLKKVRCKIAFG